MFLRFVVFNTALCQFVGAPNRGTLRRIKHIKAEAKEKTFRAELFFFFLLLCFTALFLIFPRGSARACGIIRE